MNSKRGVFVGLGAALWACCASGQTNDANFRSWGYYEDQVSPRAAGMGGAFVAVVDDSGAVAVNPAGLVTLTRTDVQAALLQRGRGSLAGGDTAASATSPGFIGGGGKLTRTIAVGAYVTEPHELDVALTPGAASPDSGFLRTTVTDAGVALGFSPLPSLQLGVRLNVTHMDAQGEYVHPTASGGLAASEASAETKLAGDAGILWSVSEAATVGVSFTQGARWDASRLSEALVGGSAARESFQLSSPSTLRSGGSYRPSPRVLVAGELDYVFLARLDETFLPALQPAKESDYVLKSGLEARGGIEASLPLRSAVTLVARGGLWSQAPASFAFVGQELPANASPFPGGTRHTLVTLGAGFATRSFRLDGAAALGGVRTVLTLGAGVRF